MLRELSRRLAPAATAALTIVGVGCGPTPTPGSTVSGPAPRAIVQNYEVLIRNDCITPVKLALSKQRPSPATETFEVASGAVDERTMPSDQRLWLWDKDGWSSKRARSASQDPYVFDIYCHAIEGRRGPL